MRRGEQGCGRWRRGARGAGTARASTAGVRRSPAAALSAGTGGGWGTRSVPRGRAKSPETFRLLDYRGALIYSE